MAFAPHTSRIVLLATALAAAAVSAADTTWGGGEVTDVVTVPVSVNDPSRTIVGTVGSKREMVNPKPAYWEFTAKRRETWLCEAFEGQTLISLFQKSGKPDEADVVQVCEGTNILVSASATDPADGWRLVDKDGRNVDDFIIPRYSTIKFFRASSLPITLFLSGLIGEDEYESVNAVLQGNIDFNSKR